MVDGKDRAVARGAGPGTDPRSVRAGRSERVGQSGSVTAPARTGGPPTSGSGRWCSQAEGAALEEDDHAQSDQDDGEQDALEALFAGTTLPITAHCEDETTVRANRARVGALLRGA